MSPTVANWGRVCRVIVGKNLTEKSNAGLLLEGFRIVFTVDQTLRGPPNTANIQVYNLNPTNAGKIKEEFDDVVLDCGYQGNPRIIFRGGIKFPTHYREGTDWITEIQAADGDRAYTEAHVGTTLAAGKTPYDAVDEVLKQMPGVRKGHIELPTDAYSRGKVLLGPARRVLEQISRDYAANWSITNGTLNIVRADSVLPSQAVVVNSQTGMIGAPEISAKGVKIKMQLNPEVVPHCAVVIDNNNIKIQAIQQYSNGPKVKEKKLVRLDPDGRYKVYKLRHQGDTRGPDWYTEVEAIGLGQPVPRAQGSI
jgi:hypothetical protein